MSKLLGVALVILAFSVPTFSWAQGKIAVVDVQGAILQTDVAQKRLGAVRDQADYKKNKAEYDRLKSEGDALLKTAQKDAAVMSEEQKKATQKKLSALQEDLEQVVRKLQQAEQGAGQALLQEMGPKMQEVLRDLVKEEKIGLLLQRNAVVHAEESYSITAKVTEKLNKLAAK